MDLLLSWHIGHNNVSFTDTVNDFCEVSSLAVPKTTWEALTPHPNPEQNYKSYFNVNPRHQRQTSFSDSKITKKWIAQSLGGKIALPLFQPDNRDLNLNYCEASLYDSCMSVLISYLLCTILGTRVGREDTITTPQCNIAEVQLNDGVFGTTVMVISTPCQNPIMSLAKV